MFQIQFRRDVSSRWREINPVLAVGEPGYETDTGKLKIGNAVQRWLDLPYINETVDNPDDLSAVYAALSAHINSLTPHPVYDDGPSLTLLYQNAKV